MKTPTAIIILVLLVAPITVLAWDDRLAECSARGIPRSECPRTGPLPPSPPPAESDDSSHDNGRGHRSNTHGVWVINRMDFLASNLVCYNAHYRVVREFKDHREFIDFPERTVTACTDPKYAPINLVKE